MDSYVSGETEQKQKYKMRLLIEGYSNELIWSVQVPMDILSVIFMHCYAFVYESKVKKCEEIVRKIKWIKKVNKLRP